VLVAAAFLPHPPALVPEVAAGAAHELADVREACAVALQRVLEAHPDLVVVVGDDRARSTYAAGSAGSFAGFGVPVAVALPGSELDVENASRRAVGLPLSLAVAAWCMNRVGPWPSVRAEGVPATMSAPDAVTLGARLADSADHVALIVMGDGAATLTERAPGYLVEGAEQWQKAVTSALADADTAAIAAIAADDARRFQAVGRVPWQVAAGAAAETTPWISELLADDAPYGVAYAVARWQRASA